MKPVPQPRTQEKPTRRRRTTKYQPVQIDDLLAQCRDIGIFLRAEGDRLRWWAPGVDVPPSVHHRLTRHKQEILRLLALADPRVCPSRELHRHAVITMLRHPACPYCDELKPWIALSNLESSGAQKATTQTRRKG